MLLRILLFCCLVPFSAAAPASPNLLVLGDSLGAAFGMEPEQGWAALLQQRLTARGHPHRVGNASISGDTTAGGLRRLPDLLKRHRPEILVIELGGNDGLRGLPLKAMRSNLEQMVTLSRRHVDKIVLVGVRMPPNYGPRYSDGFAAVFRDVAREQGTALVPELLNGVGERLELMQGDGIHPLPEAQPQLLDNLWPALEPLLAD